MKAKQHEQPARGSVRADELMPLREFGRRLGLASRSLQDAQRRGLRTVLFGRTKYILGRDAIHFFDELADGTATQHITEEQNVGQ